MANEVIPFAQAEVPAHLAAVFGDGNIEARFSIDQLSYKGKQWSVVIDGKSKALTKLDKDTQEVVPVNIINIVVLDHNKKRSRAFYAGDFVDGANKAPDCFSGDGITPDSDVKEPVAKTCATCPNSVKGSKITPSGAQTTLCSPFKRVAIVPSGIKAITDHPVMLLRLAQTSVWDKDDAGNQAKGWYAWDQYLDMLRGRGCGHTAAVETRVKFDMDKAYPKLLFSASRWLDPEEALAAKAKIEGSKEVLDGIINGKQSQDGMTGQPAAAEGSATPAANTPDPAVEAAKQAAAVEQAAQAAAAAEAAKKAAKKAAAKQAAADALAAAQAAAAAAEEDDDDDGGFGGVATPAVEKVKAEPVDKPAKAAKAAPTAPPVEVIEAGDGAVPAGVASLLDNWDDE